MTHENDKNDQKIAVSAISRGSRTRGAQKTGFEALKKGENQKVCEKSGQRGDPPGCGEKMTIPARENLAKTMSLAAGDARRRRA